MRDTENTINSVKCKTDKIWNRLEIGRYFDRSSVFYIYELGFLSRGDTTDSFRVEWKLPELWEVDDISNQNRKNSF